MVLFPSSPLITLTKVSKLAYNRKTLLRHSYYNIL
jgi:hypothetical protein